MLNALQEFGVGWVVAKGANHFSIAGHWALMAEKEGLIGMAFTNTSPKVYFSEVKRFL